jgi:hypothetical protein
MFIKFDIIFQGEIYDGELTNLEMIHFWIHLIYVHTSHNTKDSIDNTGLSPPIFIVGTHRHGLHQEDGMQLKMVCLLTDICDRL